MAITTHSELLTAVANWINRDDLTDRIPECIALAEAVFNSELRVPEMEEALSETISSETLALPTNFLAVRSLYIDRNPDVELQWVPYGALRFNYGSETTGIPTAYTIANEAFVFGPVPNASMTLKGIYWKKIPALTVSNTTNWLLTSRPDAYLYGTLAQAAVITRDDGGIALYTQLMNRALAGVQNDGVNKAMGGSPLVAMRRGSIWGPSSSKGVW